MRKHRIAYVAVFVGTMLFATSAAIIYKHHKLQNQNCWCLDDSLYVDASASNPITEITVTHTQCEGPCPVYKVSFKKSGEAFYIGEANVERIGAFKGQVYKDSFLYLSRFIEKEGFFAMKDYYPENCFMFDIPHTVISVTRDGKRKSVDSQGGVGPVERWGIGEAVDGVANEIKWERIPDAPATISE
jgi:hypothetical protein